MKVYLLLEYDQGNCRVHSVYTKKESADKRACNENKREMPFNRHKSSRSFHVISKTLKGKVK